MLKILSGIRQYSLEYYHFQLSFLIVQLNLAVLHIDISRDSRVLIDNTNYTIVHFETSAQNGVTRGQEVKNLQYLC